MTITEISYGRTYSKDFCSVRIDVTAHLEGEEGEGTGPSDALKRLKTFVKEAERREIASLGEVA